MAIGTPVSIGTGTLTGTGATITITTTGTVAAGDHVVLGYYVNHGLRPATSITGTNGLTWQKDVELQSGASSGATVQIWSAYAAAGLASGVTIIANFTSTSMRGALVAMDISGLDPTTWADQTQTNRSASAQTGWDTGTTGTRTRADEISIAVAGEEGVNATTSTTNGPATELHEVQASGRCVTSAYQIHSSTGTSQITGSFTTSESSTQAAIVTYMAAVATTTIPELVMARRI